ncbi:hypothetical protein DM01DRAFT_1053159 [Hesseltinella vesiculosa]|uniref:Uncharacterized protein n=1 Tax=Hesseltinella vesiculosa TaxID=101127 RepID=A0A1X2GGH5_9FUNG|nr:hypothetical protein DM01DRAFT_1053159 [Hesseltinella vesiculosa]
MLVFIRCAYIHFSTHENASVFYNRYNNKPINLGSFAGRVRGTRLKNGVLVVYSQQELHFGNQQPSTPPPPAVPSSSRVVFRTPASPTPTTASPTPTTASPTPATASLTPTPTSPMSTVTVTPAPTSPPPPPLPASTSSSPPPLTPLWKR